MDRAISATDANRNFSRLLHGIRKGYSYVVTSHGKPIAKVIPMAERDKVAAGARSALLARLRSQRVVDVDRWTRDELYEDAE